MGDAPDDGRGGSRGDCGHLVAVEGLAKRYQHRVVVESVALALRPGDVCGVIGANGGGKTTTLRMLAGILKPDRGRGWVLGFDLMSDGGEIRRRVGYMSQRFSLYAGLSVFENLRFRAQVYGLDKPRNATEAAIEDFGLAQYRGIAVGRLSGGWTRRLQLAAAVIHSPRLILLDEPTAGLDAGSRQDVWRRIERLAARGAGVIVSTHDLAEAERCSHTLFLSQGRVVAVGTPEQVARSAPAAAFLMCGIGARLLAERVETVVGVLGSYPQGQNLRVVANPEAGELLHRVAIANGVSLTREKMQLEDAALAFSGQLPERPA